MTRKRRILLVAVSAAIAIGLIGSELALGTPGFGVTSATVTARGTADGKVKTRGNQPYDVVDQVVTIAAGGHTGWHSHPGMAIVVVKSGTLTIYYGDDPSCTPHITTAGQVFLDQGYGDVHIGRNEGTTTLELSVTYLDVPIGGAFRIDKPAPGNCAF
jgi:quercetin dioxygenase-like cupin family protein